MLLLFIGASARGRIRDTHDPGPDRIRRRRNRREPSVYSAEYYERLRNWQKKPPQERGPPPAPIPNLLIPLGRLIPPTALPSLLLGPPERPVPSLTLAPPPFRMATADEISSDEEELIAFLMEMGLI